MRRGAGTWRRAIVAGVVTAMLVAAMPAALAKPPPRPQPDHKTFVTSITPHAATAGTETVFDLTITNTSSRTGMGAARITVPDGFEVGETSVDRSDWSVIGSPNPITVAASDTRHSLRPGESVVVTIEAVTPLQDGDHTYRFDVAARQANQFRGEGNALRGSGPSVAVTGTAVDCDPGVPCQASFSEAGTEAVVSTTCDAYGGDCGNLVLDLDEDCLGQDCVGRAVFWLPPVIDSGTVDLVLRVPATDLPYEGVAFYVASKDDETAQECDLVDDHYDYYGGYGVGESGIDCTYEISFLYDHVEIRATVERVDPRGFVS
jgi:hypothetical protein